jgi:hypothetical protein
VGLFDQVRKLFGRRSEELADAASRAPAGPSQVSGTPVQASEPGAVGDPTEKSLTEPTDEDRESLR